MENKNYTVKQDDKDVFASYYSEFLLNFGMEQLMSALDA